MANAPNAAAWSNMQNALLSYARIREAQESGASLRATREATRLKQEQDTRTLEETQRAQRLKTLGEGLTGSPWSPDTQQALFSTQKMMEPGAPPVVGTTGQAQGLGVPNLVTRRPMPQDFEASARSNVENIMRPNTLAMARTMIPETHPTYQYLATSPQVVPASQVGDVITKQATTREAQSKAEKTALEADKERAAAPYYESNARYDSMKKMYDSMESRFNVEQQPERAKEQRLKNEKLDTEIEQNNQAIAKQNYIFDLVNAAGKTNDPNIKADIYRKIAEANGQTPQLLAHDLQTSEAAMKHNVESLRSYATGKQHFVNKQFEEGMAAYNIGNKQAVQAAKMNKSPTVTLMVPQRIAGYFYGEHQPVIGTVKTRTERAEMYVNGELDAIANGTLQKPTGNMIRLEPGLDPQIEYYDPADALAWKIYYDNLPIANNTAEMTRILSNYNAPADVKERALRKLQVVTREAPPSLENVPQNTGTALPTAIDAPGSRAAFAKIDEDDERRARGMAERSAARKLTRATEGGRQRERSMYIADKAREAGITPNQASPAQVNQWGTEFDQQKPAKLKPNVEEGRKQFAPLASEAAQKHGLDPELYNRLVFTESRYDPNVVSPKGAVGLAQLMPGTAKDLKVDPKDPVQNLDGGARYLRQLLDRYGGDMRKALIAYNWGMGNYENSLKTGEPLPADTQAYVASIMR